MAVAEKTLAAQFNRNGHDVIDHYTYVFAGDGCLMEGISHEVCSLAGTLKLGKLIVLYDNNGISIDGEVAEWFSDDTAKRFGSYGWQVITADGHDSAAIAAAIEAAQGETDKPSLISCKTVIGFGSPNKGGTAATHGAPLGEEEVAAVRENWAGPMRHLWCRKKSGPGMPPKKAWSPLERKLVAYEEEYPELAMELVRASR